MDPFSDALVAISVSTELIEEELRPHLDTLLSALQEKQEGAARQIADSGILPSLAHILRRTNLKLKAILIVSELAGDGLLQDQLIRNGAVPSLAAILQKYSQNEALVSACLFALCGLADMSEEDSSGLTWEELSRVSQGELAYRGAHRHPFGFSSKVTVVRLNQRSGNQHSVTVEVVHRCSRALWGAYVAQRTGRRFRPAPFEACPQFHRIIKFGVRNIPKTQSLKSRVFHTFL
ncbi:uncharacterized protein si:dkey-21e13.3 isoform X2 [Anguilla anguilla]|uniref:uncharacterized protein si:dkey-21e13.3 isoform X2 n=1 Tax=Anguilla anguilla TaxID=7936 RepID=UPI0015B247A3|nr:uncharacterized protein si:dkey-21e13.3 isoform X2 [Anguilla anguilla]